MTSAPPCPAHSPSVCLSPRAPQASSGVKQWNKRWFVLVDRCLFYYKGEPAPGLRGRGPTTLPFCQTATSRAPTGWSVYAALPPVPRAPRSSPGRQRVLSIVFSTGLAGAPSTWNRRIVPASALLVHPALTPDPLQSGGGQRSDSMGAATSRKVLLKRTQQPCLRGAQRERAGW